MSETEQETGPDTAKPDTEPVEEPTGDEPTDEVTEPGDDENETAPPTDLDPDEQEAAEEPEGLSEQEIEQAHKKLAKLRETTAGRVSAIMGDAALALIPCPACADVAPSFVWDPSAAPPSEEAAAGMRALLGIGVPQTLKRHPDFQTCGSCDGEGFIDTGSKREGYESSVCPNCTGKGWQGRGEVPVVAPANGHSDDEPILTGPSVYGHELPPEAQRLRDEGWVVSPPITIPTPAG